MGLALRDETGVWGTAQRMSLSLTLEAAVESWERRGLDCDRKGSLAFVTRGVWEVNCDRLAETVK